MVIVVVTVLVEEISCKRHLHSIGGATHFIMLVASGFQIAAKLSHGAI